MSTRNCDLGLIGLGVMGRNLLLNFGDRGFEVVGYDLDNGKVAALDKERTSERIHAVGNLAGMIELLRVPRAVMLMVPAGEPVDAVIAELLPHLGPGDVVVDGGNSFYRDTDRRSRELAKKGIEYLGVGVSGGEYGARNGPCLMPGGSSDAYRRLRPLFEKATARVHDDPCVAYLGPGSAGHYVKLVHNGIEYGVMELIAESYDLMRQGLGLTNDELHAVYARWNEGELASYLLEITASIFRTPDDGSASRLVDVIRDVARQKGTGKWTCQDAMDLGVPVPTIDAAVAMRNLSRLHKEREAASRAIPGTRHALPVDRETVLSQLEQALYAGVILTFAQGLALLQAASKAYGYGFDPETVARIWRGGCIIQAAVLEPIRSAYRLQPDLPNLLLDPELGGTVTRCREALRQVVHMGIDFGIPAPAFMASLAYFDGYRSARLPTNLIQAQRDFFGSHTYERIDRPGSFHTRWDRG